MMLLVVDILTSLSDSVKEVPVVMCHSLHIVVVGSSLEHFDRGIHGEGPTCAHLRTATWHLRYTLMFIVTTS